VTVPLRAPPAPLSLHDALPISPHRASSHATSRDVRAGQVSATPARSIPSSRLRLAWACFSHMSRPARVRNTDLRSSSPSSAATRSEEHTSELQSRFDLVCRLLL